MRRKKSKIAKILSCLLFFGMILGTFPAIPTVQAKMKYETLAFDKKLETVEDFEKGELKKVKIKKTKEGAELELSGQESGEYITAEVQAPFEANHIGLHWKENLADESLVTPFVRTRNEGENFGEWIQAGVELEDRPDNRGTDEVFASLVYADEKTYAQARLEFNTQNGKAPKVKDLTFTFLNSGEDAQKTVKEITLAPKADAQTAGVLKTSVGGQAVNVVSREMWGANEDYRFKDGKEDWPRSYHGTRKLVVHHTAVKKSNGETDIQENMEAIRSTYYYHAITQGWGDIGYHSLVDAAGNVYEGRYSTREGATRVNPSANQVMVMDVEAGHTAGYNQGSFGVAAMGDFTRFDVPQAQLEGLKKVLTYAADERGVNVQGESDFRRYDGSWRLELNNLIGHSDATATACPGERLYPLIPDIKNHINGYLRHNLSGFDATLNGVDIEGTKIEAGILNFDWDAFTDSDTGNAASRYQYLLERIFGTPGVVTDSQSWETAWFSSGVGTTDQLATQIDAGTLESDSNYVFYVRALDSSGNPLSTTKHVNFETGNVVITDPPQDVIAPQVSVVSPIQGAEVSGTVTISAEATDEGGVVETRFFVNDQLIGVDSEFPYSIEWNSENVADGAAVISASAYDAATNEGISAEVTVTVNNAVTPEPEDTLAPTTPENLTAQAVSQTQINLAWNASTDNVGVTGYKIFRDGNYNEPIATTESTSYQDMNLQPATGYSYAVSAFDAAGNQSELFATVSATTQDKVEDIPPIVTFRNPADEETVSKVVQVSVTATDDAGVALMELWIDETKVAESAEGSLNYAWNTRKSGTGPHTLTAVATDTSGHSATDTVEVNVVR